MCNKTVDIGFVVGFSSSQPDIHKEEAIKEFVIESALSLNIFAKGGISITFLLLLENK